MKQKIFIFMLFCFSVFAQQLPLRSPVEIEKFANYLFSKRDYLRASEQFLLLPPEKVNDTINLRIAKCYLELDTLELSDVYLAKVTKGSLAATGAAARYRYLFKTDVTNKLFPTMNSTKG